MRKVAGWVLACMLACAPAFAFAQQLAAIPTLDKPVIDTTGTLDPTQVAALDTQARALQKRKGAQLQILMVPTTQPETIEQYTVRAFEQYKLGRQKVDDGVLIVVAKNDRRVRIEPGYGLEGAIPDAIANRVIQEYLVPKFRAGDFGGGLIDATAALVKLIDGEPLPAPMADNAPARDGGEGGGWMIALIAAFLIAQVARGIFSFLPAGVRAVLGGAASGGAAWLIGASLIAGGLGAVIGLVIGLAGTGPRGRFARHGGWGGMPGGWGGGGGGWGGGGFGGGGGGWSGGGGSSGGGGASGGW